MISVEQRFGYSRNLRARMLWRGVYRRRGRAAPQSGCKGYDRDLHFLLIQAVGTRPHRSVDLVNGPTLEAKWYNGRSNLRMINQSNLGGVCGL
jgi:hypothetical protein